MRDIPQYRPQDILDQVTVSSSPVVTYHTKCERGALFIVMDHVGSLVSGGQWSVENDAHVLS
jgi:hypothetical protein